MSARCGAVWVCQDGGQLRRFLKAQDEAEKQGTQVLWLDGVERKYIEEVGTMNVFFQLGDEVVTPELPRAAFWAVSPGCPVSKCSVPGDTG